MPWSASATPARRRPRCAATRNRWRRCCGGYENDGRRWRLTPEDRAALAAEVDSLRAAMAWAQAEGGEDELLLELAALSSNVWIYAGLNVEGMKRCAAARRAPASPTRRSRYRRCSG